MFRFTIRDVLWLTVVIGMGIGWWMQAQKTKTVNRTLDGLQEMVNSSGWMQIERTSPGSYFVKNGKQADMLMKELKTKNAAATSEAVGANQPATLNRP
jgi:hypothetical protein